MNIFISHAHEDKPLAKAWRELLNCVSNGEIDPWYSSDDRVEGGVGPGNWREEIQEKIETADVLLIIITPGSNERPWLLWESGFAAGKSKEIIPVIFFLRNDNIHSVFETKQKYNGELENDVLQLCERIVSMATKKNIPSQTKDLWKTLVKKYIKKVNEEKKVSLSKRLFHKHFHQEQIADGLSGTWYAKWTQLNEDNSEDIWETDKLYVWPSETRIRMVGYNSKEGTKTVENTEFYPMEGVISSRGWVALSYWSGGTVPICGTCLLKPYGLTGDILLGSWQGFTARDLSEEPRFTQGRVLISKRQEIVESFFNKSAVSKT
ncbi:MAG: toll/interleukin-1 receptor domain-containing protein [Ginsengibacter sp.]